MSEPSGVGVDPKGGRAGPVDLLLQAFRQGKPGAFDAIVLAHQGRVYAFCARMLSDRVEAMDVAQEVFISAYRNLGGFREEASLSTWLLKIAANRCLNRIRQRSSLAAREVVLPDAAERDEPPFQPPAPEEGRPDRIAENREMARILERALGRIDPDSRWLLLLSDVEGFTYEEVAAMAGIPVGTVKSRLHRARMALRKILAPVV
jgi:RNA polymerase sigma-70 factor (ECF subfamily)